MAVDLCKLSLLLECLLICVTAYCQNSDQDGECSNKFICVPDECGVPMYVCEDPFPVEPGKCPYFNKQLKKMDVTECTADQKCPSEPYLASNLVQKSEDCLAKAKRTHRCPDQTINIVTSETYTGIQSSRQTRADESSGSGAGVVVGVVVALLIIVVVILLVVFYIRNQFGFRDKVQLVFINIRIRLQWNREEGTPSPAEIPDEENGMTEESEKLLLKANEDPLNDTEKQKQGNKDPGNDNEKQKQEEKATYATVIKDTSKKKEKRKEYMTVADSGEHHHWREEEEMKMKIRKLNFLQKYLVHILKREIDVKDLKENSILHSESLRDHFTQPVLQDLYSVEKHEDYSKLDMSLVFALLRNFCVNIKPPKRGWDYEPTDDEQTVGADIERIRSMWNKYCDNNYEFKNLDDVFKKMKQKYGTVAVQDDQELQNKTTDEMEGFSDLKEKIQSITLNPDCFVEKGIVKTEGVKSALQSLETWSVVICKGAIGCGKTYALKAIQNRYKEKGWKVRWMEERLFPQEENLEDKTIVICDNLFGSYGCNTFSSNGISNAEALLGKVREKSRNIKVAVGIHQHVFDEIKKNAHLKILQNKNITVDLEKPTKSEMLLILKEQQKEGHCKTDPTCWFKDIDLTFVIDRLSQNQGHIGSPFLSLMYYHQHDLLSDEAFTRNPLQSLTQQFQKMRNDSNDYYSLVYLMCVRKHTYGDELNDWAGTLDANLTKEALENTARKMPGFIGVKNGVETLRHEVLTIALFKAATSVQEVFLPVVQRCEIGILFQLMRPADSSNTEFSCGFAYPEKTNTQVRNIGKHLVKRFADAFKSNWNSIEHPFKHHEFFKEKFEHYLTNTPKEKK